MHAASFNHPRAAVACGISHGANQLASGNEPVCGDDQSRCNIVTELWLFGTHRLRVQDASENAERVKAGRGTFQFASPFVVVCDLQRSGPFVENGAPCLILNAGHELIVELQASNSEVEEWKVRAD